MWKDLTLKEKAEVMRMSVANGVTDINDIQSLYDNSVGHLFDDGGNIEKPIGHLYAKAGPLAKKKPYDYGDPNEITRIIADHESFRNSPYEDGPESGWYSVGFGTNNHGGAGQDANMRKILGYGWKELHAGRKMTREEATKLMLYDINNNIKPLLRRTLGDKLYSELPGNFLNTFIDMGYQSPARMIKAARTYKTSGPDAAIKAMMMGRAKKVGGGTYDLTQRNNQRRAMWGASSSAYHKMYEKPDLSTSNDILSDTEQKIHQSDISEYLQSIMPVVQQPIDTFIPGIQQQAPTPIEERVPLENIDVTMAPYLFSIPEQQESTHYKLITPEYESIPTPVMYSDPYILFGK